MVHFPAASRGPLLAHGSHLAATAAMSAHHPSLTLTRSALGPGPQMTASRLDADGDKRPVGDLRKVCYLDGMSALSTLTAAAREIVKRDAIAELQAATLEWDQERKHLRLTFLIVGVPQDVELEALELAGAEIVGSCWQEVMTAGPIFVFDELLLASALTSPSLIYLR